MRVGTLGIGGGGRNRTAVRRYSRPGTTCLAHRLVSPCGNTACEAHRRTHPLDLGHGWRVAAAADPVIMTLHPRAQAQVGSGLGLKRPERRRRRWRLIVCRWINEESCPLGMRRAISQPPSKPVHPRECRCRRHAQYRSALRDYKGETAFACAWLSLAHVRTHRSRG